MGTATIVMGRGEGLYQVTLNRDRNHVEQEINQLTLRQAEYFSTLLQALNSLDDLRRAKVDAIDGMNALIQQWKDLLIEKFNEEPPAIEPPEPNDPETGEPWEDLDRAQDGPLFDAINAERVAASVDPLTRDSALDAAILIRLRTMAGTGKISYDDDGWSAADRVWSQGYDYSVTVGVGQVQAFGMRTPAETVALWMRRSNDRALLLNANYTECGVAYVYAPRNPYSYLWGAIFATPGPPLPTFAPPEKDAAQEAADAADATLDKIELPTIETFEPDKLGAAAAEAAVAALRVRHAEQVVANLKIDYQDRDQRLIALAALLETLAETVDVWTCRYVETLSPGDVVKTAEIPGFWQTDSVLRTTTMGVRNDPNNTIPNTVVPYYERAINLIPADVIGDPGGLRLVAMMSGAQAFFHAAIEPGHVRWRPLWRYGTITAKSGNSCSVTLASMTIRGPDQDQDPLILDETEPLTGVPISYPPCDGEVFNEGDEVLILFEGQDRSKPKVIGFRREPKPCPGGRMSWAQLS